MRKNLGAMFSAFLAAVGIALGLCASTWAAPCNPRFVVQKGPIIAVLPTGVDDTEDLQCAFNSAVAAGQGMSVRLQEGTYHTRQIVVNNFNGSFTGAGADRSVLTNLPNLYVTPVNMYFNAPSANNPWPSLVAFVGGNFQVSDLGIHITGTTPTTGWTIFGLPTLYWMAHGFVVLGTRANAFFSRVDVEGEYAPSATADFNLGNGIYFEGFIGEVSPPISGSFIVLDSTFRNLESSAPIADVSDASILISHNNFQDGFDAMDVEGLLNSRYEFSFNTVEGGLFGGDAFDGPPVFTGVQVTDSRILVTNNAFNGAQYGIYLDTTFAGGSGCTVVANTFQNVTNIGIYLGAGTSHCTVAGNSPTSIVNLGTDNKIVGGRPSSANVPPPSNSGLWRRLHP